MLQFQLKCIIMLKKYNKLLFFIIANNNNENNFYNGYPIDDCKPTISPSSPCADS